MQAIVITKGKRISHPHYQSVTTLQIKVLFIQMGRPCWVLVFSFFFMGLILWACAMPWCLGLIHF